MTAREWIEKAAATFDPFDRRSVKTSTAMALIGIGLMLVDPDEDETEYEVAEP